MDPRQFVEQQLQVIRLLFEEQKELYPTVILIKDNTPYQVNAHYNNEAHKDIVSQGIKDLVKGTQPDAVIFFAEAWMKTIKSREDRIKARLSLDPDRIEIVTVQIEFKTGEKFGCTAKILRDEKNISLDKFEITGNDFSMGRFVDFFPITRTN
jgi:hypothetical protein